MGLECRRRHAWKRWLGEFENFEKESVEMLRLDHRGSQMRLGQWRQSGMSGPWRKSVEIRPWRQSVEIRPWRQSVEIRRWRQSVEIGQWRQSDEFLPLRHKVGFGPLKIYSTDRYLKHHKIRCASGGASIVRIVSLSSWRRTEVRN